LSDLWAAVAVVVAPDRRVLFIRRTRRPGDPWGGDMAFPGGFRAPADAEPVDTARRETTEEVGLELGAPARRLPWRWAFHPGLRRPCRLVPFVFEDVSAPLVLEPAEVSEAVWIPLEHLRTSRVREWWPRPIAVRTYGGRRIWGISGRIVDDLVQALPHRIEGPQEDR
jgi:8-oxo-dGTP pyrophosphatase MutT (NUDIX family)